MSTIRELIWCVKRFKGYFIVLDLMCKRGLHGKVVHIINIDIRDNPEEAKLAGEQMIELVDLVCITDFVCLARPEQESLIKSQIGRPPFP